MKRTFGYICSPSSGTVSLANGTTSPMVKSLGISFSSKLIFGGAGGLNDRRPFFYLRAQIDREFLWRARHRLHSELQKMRLGRGLGKNAGQRPVEDGKYRQRQVCRRDHALPGVRLVAGKS